MRKRRFLAALMFVVLLMAPGGSVSAVEEGAAVCCIPEAESVISGQTGIPANTRRSYDAGTCRKLEGSPYVLAIFLDDDESSWPEEKVKRYWYDLLVPGQEFIEKHAAKWGKALDFQRGFYATYGSPDRPVKYDGVVQRYIDGSYSKDILDKAAAALGFASREEMHRCLQEYTGQEQIAYVILLNKGGRCYSMAYRHSGRDELELRMEYCVIYTGFTDDSGDTASDAIAHEMLHLFGAEDYYMPEKRKALAQKQYPEDIMLCAMADLKFFDLEENTAYCVGWTDKEPAVCTEPDWWG